MSQQDFDRAEQWFLQKKTGDYSRGVEQLGSNDEYLLHYLNHLITNKHKNEIITNGFTGELLARLKSDCSTPVGEQLQDNFRIVRDVNFEITVELLIDELMLFVTVDLTEHLFHTESEHDLTIYPHALIREPIENKVSVFTIGDLHGNPVKLLNFALLTGAISLSEANYRNFCYYYENCRTATSYLWGIEIVSQEYVNNLCAIISAIEIKRDSSIILRLIGDVLADRGKCDYVTLKLLEKLHTLGVVYEILFSNHDLWFIGIMEEFIKYNLNIDVFKNNVLSLSSDVKCVDSIDGLAMILKGRFGGFIEPEELKNLYNIYLSHLKLLSCDIEANGGPILFSHGVISPLVVNKLAEKYKLAEPYEIIKSEFVGTIQLSAKVKIDNLIATVKTANESLLELAYLYKLYETVVAEGTTSHVETGRKDVSVNAPHQIQSIGVLTQFAWGRSQEAVSWVTPDFLNVHGHTGPNVSISHRHINLDNTVVGRPGNFCRSKYNHRLIYYLTKPSTELVLNLGTGRITVPREAASGAPASVSELVTRTYTAAAAPVAIDSVPVLDIKGPGL